MPTVLPALILVAALGAGNAGALEPPVDDPVEDLWFPVGERLSYRLQWGILRVGEAHLATSWVEHEGRKLLAVSFEAVTNRLVEMIYPVEHQVETLVDPRTFRPLHMTRKAREGRRTTDGVLTFDWDEGMARWDDRKRNREVDYPVDLQALDFITFMLALLRDAHEMGSEHRYEVAVDGRAYDLKATVTRKGRIRLPGAGHIPAVRVDIAAPEGGLFVRTIPEKLWITDGTVRRLAMLRLQVPVGRVKMTLLDQDTAGVDAAPEEPEDQSPAEITEDPDPSNSSSSLTGR